MTIPRISGPESWPRAFPPAFAVATDPGWFYAVELSARPELFDAAHHAQERTEDRYFASWQRQSLLDAPTFTPPPDVWARLGRDGSVAYRVHASRRRDRWESHATSTRDAEALRAPRVATFGLAWLPEELAVASAWSALWAGAAADPGVHAVRRHEAFEVVVGRHARSPRRPSAPSTLEWILVATHAAAPGERLDSVTLRLAFGSLQILARRTSTARVPSAGALDADAAARTLNALPAHQRPWPHALTGADLRRLHNVWAWQDLAPPPGQRGGTAMLHGLTGELLYAASTDWSGGRVWWPP